MQLHQTDVSPKTLQYFETLLFEAWRTKEILAPRLRIWLACALHHRKCAHGNSTTWEVAHLLVLEAPWLKIVLRWLLQADSHIDFDSLSQICNRFP